MIGRTELRFVKSAEGVDFYLFRPRPGRWYYTGWDGWAEDRTAHTRSHRVRMAIEWLEAGYRVYYMAKDDEIVGYVTVARGGGRLRCATRRDIVLGPVYTPARFRGKGYATAGEKAVLHSLEIPYDAAYEYIKKDNAPSLRVAEKCGFTRFADGQIRGRLRRVCIAKEGTGTHVIVRYVPDRPNKEKD